MLKKENGITMVMLIIMIIVMLIVAGIVVYEGTSTIKSAKKQSIYTNMLLIQAKARTIKDKADFGEDAQVVGKIINEDEITLSLAKTIKDAEEETNLKINIINNNENINNSQTTTNENNQENNNEPEEKNEEDNVFLGILPKTGEVNNKIIILIAIIILIIISFIWNKHQM